MSDFMRDRWAAISPYLDQALELSDDDRARWLASIRIQDPALAAELQMLLDEHVALGREGFLEQGPPGALLTAVRNGQPFGAYTLVSPIGQGGMGSVWLATRNDGRFEGRAAIKLLNVALIGRSGEERFKREGNILARLTHANIAHLIDAGVSPAGQPYIVLEHVDGVTIDQYCDAGSLDVEARLRLILDVLAAVAHAHANLIVHRDIKPSNVLVRTDGQVKLLDFGIAKLLEADEQTAPATILTRDGGRVLTPEYAAPEQVTGGTVTTATDVYALGVLVYVLLAGRHPAGEGLRSTAQLVMAIVDTEPPHPSDVVADPRTAIDEVTANAAKRATTPDKLRSSLRGDLDTIVVKALKKNPQERYASVTALADDIRRCLRHEPISARPDTLRYRAAKFVRRNRVPVALAAFAAVASIAGLVGTVTQARTARAQRDFAVRQLSRAETINDFNEFLLKDAAPSGKPFTVNDLLARAEHIVSRQQGSDNASRVDLLTSIGRQYWTQDEDATALRVLTQAYALSRQVSDRPIRAKAACALAGAVSRGNDLPRAEALIEEGLREVGDNSSFVLDRMFCLMRGSEVSRNSNNSQKAIARIQEAQRLLKQSPFQSDIMELRLLMDVAESYREAGRYSDAIPAFEQASLRLTALGRDDTQTAGTLFNNWALALNLLGRPLDAERIFRRGIDVSRADDTEQAVSPMLLINYARVLRDLARVDEAADYARRGYEKAQQAGDQVVVQQSLLLRAWIYTDQRDFPRATAMLAEVEPRLRRRFPPGHLALGAFASYQSMLAGARGDLPLAMQLANEAISTVEAVFKMRGSDDGYLATLLFTRRADVELRFGRFNEAAADAENALRLSRKNAPSGAFLSSVGRAGLILARARQAQGRRDEARAALTSAVEHLESALGPDHPDTQSARHLLALETPSQSK